MGVGIKEKEKTTLGNFSTGVDKGISEELGKVVLGRVVGVVKGEKSVEDVQ